MFRRSIIANMTWSYFSSSVGINIGGLILTESILAWWNVVVRRRDSVFYTTLPSMILWELWRRRNKIKLDGKIMSKKRVNIQYF